MPGFNGKGPRDEGPMTGRGLGRCATKDTKDSDPQTIQQNETTKGLGLRRWFGRRNSPKRGYHQGG